MKAKSPPPPRPLICPVCHLPYENRICVNPRCWVDNNPKQPPSRDWPGHQILRDRTEKK